MSVLTPRRPGPASDSRTQLWVDVPFTKAPASATGDLQLSGYASTWGLDRDEEMVAPGAFDKSLESYLSKNPMLLWQHNMDWPLGRVTSGHTDDTGLYITASIPNPGDSAADWQKGAYTAIKNGVVRTFSIGGFMAREVKSGPAGPLFVISEVELYEVSCVSIPANADSIYEAAVKALRGELPRLSEKAMAQMEQLLGFKAVSDPELAHMAEDEREDRYDALKALFVRANGTEPPEYDSWRRVDAAIEAGVNPLKTAVATSLVAKAFYSPVPDEDEKAGRVLSATNRAKLEEALGHGDDMASHMVAAAESMQEAAKSHGNATATIKGVLGMMDGPDPDDDAEEDEPANSPTKAAPESSDRVKALMSDVSRQLESLGKDRFGQSALGQPGLASWLSDADLDAGFAVYAVYDPHDEDADTDYLQVPILRGADGSFALGDSTTPVERQTSFVPKSVKQADAPPEPAEPASEPEDAPEDDEQLEADRPEG